MKILFHSMGRLALLWAALLTLTACSSAQRTPAAQTQRGQPFAQAILAKPNQFAGSSVAALPTATPLATEIPPAAVSTALPSPTLPSPTLESTPTLEAIPTAEVSIYIPPTDAPTTEPAAEGAISAQIVDDTPTPEYVAPTAPVIPAAARGDRWIDVDLTQQRLYAYEGDTLVNSFVVSTGTWQTPTVTGTYSVWIKLRSAPMSGPGYYLPNVPYIMYFYGSYGIHGTYWHNNFGTPMSHGCVNMSIPDSEWMYNFASVGTVVNVHY
ncbi:MAG: hypothetical protein Fur002_03340 [Anaerolineales bacterium]